MTRRRNKMDKKLEKVIKTSFDADDWDISIEDYEIDWLNMKGTLKIRVTTPYADFISNLSVDIDIEMKG